MMSSQETFTDFFGKVSRFYRQVFWIRFFQSFNGFRRRVSTLVGEKMVSVDVNILNFRLFGFAIFGKKLNSDSGAKFSLTMPIRSQLGS